MIKTFWASFRFELLQQRRRYSNILYFFFLMAFGVLLVAAAGGAFPGSVMTFGGSQKSFVNGPYSIFKFFNMLGIMGALIAAPLFGLTVCRDYEAKFDAILFSKPLPVRSFYLGRFVAAALVSALILCGSGIGFYIGTKLPQIQASLFTENRWSAYLLPYLIMIFPNVFIFGSIAFFVAAVSRRMSTVNIVILLVFMTNAFASNYSSAINHKGIRSLIDPFGANAMDVMTEYWSIAEQNHRLVTLGGYLLGNRLIWIGVALVVLALGLILVRHPFPTRNKKTPTSVLPELRPLETMRGKLDFSLAARIKLLFSQALYEARSSMRNFNFLCFVAMAVLYVFLSSSQLSALWGTPTYPLMPNLIEINSVLFGLFINMILAFYTGELIWRERQARMDQIFDALPLPSWVSAFAKYLALQFITAALLLVLFLCCLALQLKDGFFQPDVGIAFRLLFGMEFVQYFVLSAIIFLIHVLTNNKYFGYAAVSMYFGLRFWVTHLGLEHALYLPASNTSAVAYSAMNGFGDLSQLTAFQGYWGLFALLLLVASYLFWRRGTNSEDRWNLARERLNRPLIAASGLIILAFAGQGSYIFYNTNVLNDYQTKNELRELQANYEKTYRKDYWQRPGLQVSSVKASVDIYPGKSGLKAKVDYILTNRWQEPIDELFVYSSVPLKYTKASMNREATRTTDDSKLDVQIYRFAEPVKPGESLELRYSVDYQEVGFENRGRPTLIVGNGSFFSNRDYFPSFGYQVDAELSDEKDRKQFGLAPKERMASIDDPLARRSTYMSPDGDWIDFEATVSTVKDQIALAPGYLQKEWTEGDRRFFHYKMDRKILNFYSFVSAAYEVRKDRWNDVALEIYYQKGHEYNIDRMMAAVKDGLSTYSQAFGPYQFQQFRILEFPRYRNFAQSFPNTVPFSEGIGFIAKVDPKSKEDVDYPYYVTAHELAHQWWGHQVVGGKVQGSTLLSETLSQYSALLVLEKKYGREKMGRFLQHELNDYLQQRTKEREKELPLMLNENQAYIFYQKGSLAMYALKTAVGEEKLNAAIRKFADKVRYQSAPFTTAKEFVATLKENLPVEQHALIDDVLEKITFYDGRIQKQELSQQSDGGYRIELEILGRKLYVDGHGDETEAKFSEEMEIAVQDEDDTWLSHGRYPIKSGVNHVVLKVPGTKKPKSVVLDPLGYLIDRNRDDNRANL